MANVVISQSLEEMESSIKVLTFDGQFNIRIFGV